MGPNIDPWGTSKTISIHVLYELFILVLYFLFKKQSWVSLKTGKLKPYVFNFAIKRSWFRQSNALERSVSRAPNTLPLSIDLFHFTNKAKRHCWKLTDIFFKTWHFLKHTSSRILFIKLEIYLLPHNFLLSFYYTFYAMVLHQHASSMMKK